MKHTETLTIEGMGCNHCVATVKQALVEMPGVEVTHVEIGSAQISYDPAQTEHAAIVNAIEERGYQVT